MPNLTLSLSEKLHKRLKNHPEIRWSEIARQAIQQYVDQLELMNKLTLNSQLTETEVEELSEIIDEKILLRVKEFQSQKDVS